MDLLPFLVSVLIPVSRHSVDIGIVDDVNNECSVNNFTIASLVGRATLSRVPLPITPPHTHTHTQAVCCADKLHCCPHGSTCDLSKGTCEDEQRTTASSSMMHSTAAADAAQQLQQCAPHSTVACPRDGTCCPDADAVNHFSCCPFADVSM